MHHIRHLQQLYNCTKELHIFLSIWKVTEPQGNRYVRETKWKPPVMQHASLFFWASSVSFWIYITVNSRFHKKTTRRGSHSLRGDIIRCKCWAGPPELYYFLLIFKNLFIRRGVLYSSRPRWLFMKKGLLHRYPFCWAVVPKRLYGSSVLA